jgi:hypothetical protein
MNREGEGMAAIIREAEREVPVISAWDVIVCGAGPAGIAAAIAAARGGARTCLIEVHGCLGGIWTTGQLSYILDGRNKGGILTELLERLDGLQARQGFVCDVESTKLVLEQMCEEAGVHVRLHTRVAAALKNESNRLTHIVTESKSGREAWSSEVFIDATGDGDLAAHAGCGFAFGQEGTGVTQPMSMIALVTGIEAEQCTDYTRIETQSRNNLLNELKRGGYTPSYLRPGLWHIRDDLYIMMANHEYGASALNADDVTRATVNARKELTHIVSTLRSLGGIWAHLRLVSTGAQIGVREGRRVRGRYEVTIDDVMAGVKHEDGICRVTFGIDVHLLNPNQTEQFQRYMSDYKGKHQPYDIPMRSLIAKDVDGLLMAGRCISGDFLAHASYRVTGNAVATGQAAGVVASLAVRSGVFPHEVSSSQVRSNLEVK